MISNQEFENAYKKSKNGFVAYVYSLVRNLADTEDILQDAFSKMVEKLDSYDPSRPFEAWAMGFIRLQVLKFKQSKARDHFPSIEFSDDILNTLSEDSIGDEETRIKREDMFSIIEDGIKKLSPFSAQLIEMRYKRDMSNNEIAIELGKNVSTIGMGLTRARRELKDLISQQE